MADKFGIRVRCKSCGVDGILPADEDKEAPLLFDDLESASLHISLLKKKPVRGMGALDRALGVDVRNKMYECGECNAILPARDLTMVVFRQEAEKPYHG